MILDIFKYYAQFPKLSGVQGMFVKGKSEYPLYQQLQNEIENMPIHSRLPLIENYVFGQSYDNVKAQIDSITGTYLFVEFGTFESSRDHRNSIQDTFELASTIAAKVPPEADLVEIAIISEQTLQLAHRLRLQQFSDQEAHPWLKEISNQHRIIPFVAKEFSSIGWTVSYRREGSDMMNLKNK